ncbi:MAG TPA: aminotransferase class I/II-fold pyridoxal phosphate-dependent enzyme [Syntrophorhabdus sp.]|nr:aminotransferase class I/II-fold pyridoxal phosphate-dependent enzyme [Syntrophorhabdus sp.]
MKVTKRAELITPFYVMELLEKAKEMEARGEDIIHMEVGEPDFTMPQLVKEEAIKAIISNETYYTHSLGIHELRQKISTFYKKSEGISVSPECIVITSGTSGAFLLLAAVLLERGRTLALSDPGYPCYRNFALLADADVISIPVNAESGYQVMPDQIANLRNGPDVLIICNPSNPTGSIYHKETIAQLHEIISCRNGVLVVDEIYRGLTYGRTLRTALHVNRDIIVVNGFSKTHAMTGWRLGWMVVPQELVRPIQKVAQNVFISPPSIAQHAAVHAFDVSEYLEEMRTTYEERRNFILPRLKNLGFTVPIDPEGAFYVYAGIGKWGLDSMRFVERALVEAKVAITPGYDFGSYMAGSHVRFSYANSIERLKEGCNRLENWLQTV